MPLVSGWCRICGGRNQPSCGEDFDGGSIAECATDGDICRMHVSISSVETVRRSSCVSECRAVKLPFQFLHSETICCNGYDDMICDIDSWSNGKSNGNSNNRQNNGGSSVFGSGSGNNGNNNNNNNNNNNGSNQQPTGNNNNVQQQQTTSKPVGSNNGANSGGGSSNNPSNSNDGRQTNNNNNNNNNGRSDWSVNWGLAGASSSSSTTTTKSTNSANGQKHFACSLIFVMIFNFFCF